MSMHTGREVYPHFYFKTVVKKKKERSVSVRMSVLAPSETEHIQHTGHGGAGGNRKQLTAPNGCRKYYNGFLLAFINLLTLYSFKFTYYMLQLPGLVPRSLLVFLKTGQK